MINRDEPNKLANWFRNIIKKIKEMFKFVVILTFILHITSTLSNVEIPFYIHTYIHIRCIDIHFLINFK